MENQNYGSVIGSSSAPFINSLAAQGTTITNYHSYGANAFSGDNINGCSAACYVALISGSDNGVSDGYSCCLTGTTLVDQLQSAGLTWQAYCESGCPRGNDHFPFTGFASDANSPDIFTGSSVTTSQFIAEANSASPPNFLWYTPTDNHNMHDNSVSSGDSYLKKFLVGNGTVLTPAPGSLLASSLFGNSQYRTLLYLWWDEYDPSPNVEYGSMIKKGYTSTASYDEFSSLRMLETNWNLGTLVNSGNALPISDIFGAIGPLPLSASFTLLPLIPIVNATVNLTAIASGGTFPYSSSWSFGDGATGTGLTTTHTYNAAGNYSITLTAHDSIGGSATSTKIVRVVSVLPLAASFTASPSIPDAGQTVTFTATVQGGNGPYSYSWNMAGTSTTGNPVSQSFTNGTYAISLVVTDNAGVTATSYESLVVLPSSRAIGSVPALIGWGGIRMDESVANTGGTSSAVFPGEYASNMELVLIELKAKGYSTVRVDFDPYCTDTVDYNYMSVYSQTNAQRAGHIAQHYGFWIIIDYHGYSDIFRNTSCWLNYWKPIVQNIGPLYSQIIWEPENEPEYNSCKSSPVNCLNMTVPCSSGSSCVTYLGVAYQQWINQARSLGDTHWIVVQNLCSYACGFSDMSQGYPTVTDPLGTLSQGGRIFISLHSYMDYNQFSSSWTNTTAEALANQYYQAVVAGVSNTGWPALNTEGGTDTLSCDPNMCGPDVVLDGSAGYTIVTFHFIQTLVNLYDSNSPQRINWVWWPAGSWTNTPGTGAYGAMQCNGTIGWGCLLTFLPLGPPSPDFTISATSPSAVNTGQSASSTITIAGQNGFTGTVTLTDTVPSGLSCGTITPSRVTGSGTRTISCSSNTSGPYSLTVTGRSGSLVHTATALVAFNQTNQPDLTITATTTRPVIAGQTTTSTITLTSVNGFTGTITLSDTVPSGLNCNTISPSSLSGSGTATLSCSSNSQNVYTVTIKGTSGTLSHPTTTSFTFTPPPSFTIAATPPASVNAGSTTISTITLTQINGFTGTVSLTDSVPAGLTCGAITPSSLTGSGTATISCSSSTASTYALTLTGTSGGIIQSTTATFTVVDFIVSANPSTLALNTGISGTSKITITALNGFTGTVTLTTAPSAGLSAALSTGTIRGSGASTLTVSSGAAGTYTVVVKGTSGSLTKTTTVTVSVGAQASPVVSAPSAEAITQLNTLSFTVTGTDSSTPSPTLTLSSGQLPSGASFTTVQGTSPVSGTFRWTPSATVAPGTYTVTFIVDDGATSTQATVAITVVASNSLPILIAPSRQNATVGGTLHFSVSANDPSGVGGPITLSATGLASNMAFDPATGDFSFTPTSSQAGQTYMVNFTATDSNDPTWTRTQSVPIHVQGSSASQPSGGGFCLSCLLPRGMTTTAWLLAIGALIGIVSSIALLHIRASADLAAAKKRVKSLNTLNQFGRAYSSDQTARRSLAQVHRRRTASDDD